METELALSLVVGAVLPFILGFARRFVTLTRNQAWGLAFLVSLIAAILMELFRTDFNWGEVLSRIGYIFTLSQGVYTLVIKRLELDIRLEGK